MPVRFGEQDSPEQDFGGQKRITVGGKQYIVSDTDPRSYNTSANVADFSQGNSSPGQALLRAQQYWSSANQLGMGDWRQKVIQLPDGSFGVPAELGDNIAKNANQYKEFGGLPIELLALGGLAAGGGALSSMTGADLGAGTLGGGFSGGAAGGGGLSGVASGGGSIFDAIESTVAGGASGGGGIAGGEAAVGAGAGGAGAATGGGIAGTGVTAGQALSGAGAATTIANNLGGGGVDPNNPNGFVGGAGGGASGDGTGGFTGGGSGGDVTGGTGGGSISDGSIDWSALWSRIQNGEDVSSVFKNIFGNGSNGFFDNLFGNLTGNSLLRAGLNYAQQKDLQGQLIDYAREAANRNDALKSPERIPYQQKLSSLMSDPNSYQQTPYAQSMMGQLKDQFQANVGKYGPSGTQFNDYNKKAANYIGDDFFRLAETYGNLGGFQFAPSGGAAMTSLAGQAANAGGNALAGFGTLLGGNNGVSSGQQQNQPTGGNYDAFIQALNQTGKVSL